MKMKRKYVNDFIEEEINPNELGNDEVSSDNGEKLEEPTEENGSNQELSEEETAVKKQKKRKKGIIYISNIPKHMNVTRIKEILGQYGDIGRVYLQPEKLSESEKNRQKKRKFGRHFTEGWVEFKSKRIAKQVAEYLNNKQIGTRKRSQFYDSLWSMKYLPRFKWVHLSERLSYEQAVHKKKLMTEVSQARKEAAFFQNNLDKSEMIKKRNKKEKKLNENNNV